LPDDKEETSHNNNLDAPITSVLSCHSPPIEHSQHHSADQTDKRHG